MIQTKAMLLGSSAAVAALTIFASPAAAQVQPQSYSFNLPGQDLGEALRTFGEVTHQPIIFSEETVRGKRSAPLVGSYTQDQGLRRLLADDGLTTGRTAAGVLFVEGADSVGDNGAPPADTRTAAQAQEIVVTGSRIRRTDTTTASPINVLDGSTLAERGFTSVGDLLNQVSANAPEFPEAQASGFPAGSGQTFPNLLNLGEGRTLTLVDGRRMVTSASGLSGNAVDVNIIPAGLIDRVEIVEAGGASVYGSDAIAGVVNYVLKKNFQGLIVDAQYGEDYRGGYQQPAIRITAGQNFNDGRGNIAADFEFSKTSPLLEDERIFTGESVRSVPNPANTSTTDGIAPTMYVYGGRAWRFNENGVIFSRNTTSPTGLLQVNGSPVQFAADGQSVLPYNTGTIISGQSTAIGGQGYDFRDYSTLLAGVTRYTGNVIGHYDLTPHLKLSGEVLYAHTEGDDPYGTEYGFQGVGNGSPYQALTFTKSNPYLSAADVATLSAASPAFAAGGPLVLSKAFKFLSGRAGPTTTDTGRGLLSLDGDFNTFGRNFYYSVSFSHAETDQSYRVPEAYVGHLTNAANAVTNSSGQIVCAINAVTITDPGCSPFNIFANGVETAATEKYITVDGGSDIHDTQNDLLATLGGDVIKLPGGPVKFSVAYEHRTESARFKPTQADQEGLSGFTSAPESGQYHTDEVSGELLVPIIGGDFTLPFVKALELNGSYRLVENSVAGQETVWGAGVRWESEYGVTFRASISRNFSAPTLDELFAPSSVNPGNPAADPCDVTNINSGSNPKVRLANCQALFAAHPGYGSLATFNDPAVNTGIVAITTQGNASLKNEVSNTKTYGVVYQPKYIPGLTFSVDHINIELTNAISDFQANDFLATCYDTAPQPAAICSTFTRNAQGYLTTATEETFNAGSVVYKGDIFNLDYNFPVGRFFGGRKLGALDFAIDATKNAYYSTSVTGFDHTRTDGTTLEPRWRERFDLRYAIGPVRLFYSLTYLPAAQNSANNATIETTAVPVVKANWDHTISAQYDFRNITFRAGIDDFTNEQPSFPTRYYGDILGRRYFVGVKAKY